jgi:DMSO reductase anchor subunit
MIGTLWMYKEIVLAAAILVLAGTGTFLSFKLIRPKPFESAILTEWQCTRTAGIITVCTAPSHEARATRDQASTGLAVAR